jgi:hypothetical protein
MNVRYRVELSQSEREQLTALLSGGKHAARRLKRAQILLDIARSIGVGGSTVYRTKRRFVLGNLEAARWAATATHRSASEWRLWSGQYRYAGNRPDA